MQEYTVKVDTVYTEWLQNGQRHRENGPAIEYVDGSKYWYKKGKLHREDGPAVECSNGINYWYLNGVELTEQEFNTRMNTCNGKIVEIEGVKYKLQKV